GTLALLCFLSLTAGAPGALAKQPTLQAAGAIKPDARITEIKICYLRAYAPRLTLSLLDVPPRDEGVAGANVAIGDNNTTGNFIYFLMRNTAYEIKPESDAVQAFNDLIAKGDRYVV